ncbi:uncharacterized protein LOC129173817 [Dunckerocampus dactyliophorus]|uniref:uncharacterized protein LOC129173817 n=1 Tax=Dunckerocampus dactyliophorus TaxID=161453 RepID=UPI002404F1B2|nr:uncharacterized protein LOC129173817 [Dunckerocampus dactyliophorus]
MNKQEVRQRSRSTASPSSLTPSSHQYRWSSDFCYSSSSPVIIIRKNVKEPQPPQRGVSLVRSQNPSTRSVQRYSDPITGICSITCALSSRSSCSSCSSPVQTAVITGHDPLGWKLHPKSSISSIGVRTNRLSLQIPLPVAIPDPNPLPSNTSPTIQPDHTPKTKPPLQSKPSRRHHSDSEALLRSMPLVTLQELRDVRLRAVIRLDESDDVFTDAYTEEKVSPLSHKMPPAVPPKTPLARKIAQLIDLSRQHQRCAPPKSELEKTLYSVIKPKPKVQEQQADKHCSLYPKTNGLRVETTSSRKNIPCFPG